MTVRTGGWLSRLGRSVIAMGASLLFRVGSLARSTTPSGGSCTVCGARKIPLTVYRQGPRSAWIEELSICPFCALISERSSP